MAAVGLSCGGRWRRRCIFSSPSCHGMAIENAMFDALHELSTFLRAVVDFVDFVLGVLYCGLVLGSCTGHWGPYHSVPSCYESYLDRPLTKSCTQPSYLC